MGAGHNCMGTAYLSVAGQDNMCSTMLGSGNLVLCFAETEKEVAEDADVENNAALLNSKSNESKGKRVTTSLAGLLTALVAGIFGGELR